MRSADAPDELWRRDKINEPLVCLSASESPAREFQAELQKRGVDWFPSIETSSMDSVEAYVIGGLGTGVGLAIPGKTISAHLRALPLKGFPPVVVGPMGRGRKTALLETFLAEIQRRASPLTLP